MNKLKNLLKEKIFFITTFLKFFTIIYLIYYIIIYILFEYYFSRIFIHFISLKHNLNLKNKYMIKQGRGEKKERVLNASHCYINITSNYLFIP